MAGQAQTDYPVLALIEGLAQGPEAVRRIRHPVQEQHTAGRRSANNSKLRFQLGWRPCGSAALPWL